MNQAGPSTVSTFCSVNVTVKGLPCLRFTATPRHMLHSAILVAQREHHADEHWTLKSIQVCVKKNTSTKLHVWASFHPEDGFIFMQEKCF